MEEHIPVEEDRTIPQDVRSVTNTVVVKDKPYKVCTTGDKQMTVIGIEESPSSASEDDEIKKRDLKKWRGFIYPVRDTFSREDIDSEDRVKIEEIDGTHSDGEIEEISKFASKRNEGRFITNPKFDEDQNRLTVKGNISSRCENLGEEMQGEWKYDHQPIKKHPRYMLTSSETDLETRSICQKEFDKDTSRGQVAIPGNGNYMYENQVTPIITRRDISDLTVYASSILEELQEMKDKAFSIQTIYENLLIEIEFIKKFIKDEKTLIFERRQ